MIYARLWLSCQLNKLSSPDTELKLQHIRLGSKLDATTCVVYPFIPVVPSINRADRLAILPIIACCSKTSRTYFIMLPILYKLAEANNDSLGGQGPTASPNRLNGEDCSKRTVLGHLLSAGWNAKGVDGLECRQDIARETVPVGWLSGVCSAANLRPNRSPESGTCARMGNFRYLAWVPQMSSES
jgi:hypothetical protein